ncbi:hypothetical protein GGR50DRAFT_696346 [Xylaria sp. CBS 124048]|nr:hypothetical protein GGR50DRAFT_696346 [Xylaria sp. CBS 124048]
MNALAFSFLLAVGVAAQYPAPVAHPAGFHPPLAPHYASAPTPAVAGPPHVPGVMNNNRTGSTWSYFNTTVTTVVVVETLTTKCPEATTLTFNHHEYTATAGEVVVVTDCPCTVTTTVPKMTSSLCPPAPVTAVTLPIPPHATPSHVTPVSNMPPTSHTTPPVVQMGAASLSAAGIMKGLGAAVAAVVFAL